MRRPLVAFFGSTVVSADYDKRGAYRLFNALAASIANDPRIETVALLDRVPGVSDPCGATFFYEPAAEFLARRAPTSELDARKTNPDRMISTEQIDVFLNFWWFHAAVANPMLGLYRSARSIAYGWFLDAIPLRIPHWQPGLIPIEVFRSAVHLHLDTADRLIAISQSSADDIRHFFPFLKKPISIVPCGVFPEDFATSSGKTWAKTCKAFDLDPKEPTFVCIGVREPSKNINKIIAGAVLAAKSLQRRLQIVLLGPVAGVDPKRDFTHLLKGSGDNIKLVFPGLVSDSIRRALLSRCAALIYASKWEGFGIPPLEGMAAGAPVIVSDTGPLREVCGEHAYYCDPYDAVDIGRAISAVLTESPASRRVRTAKARGHAEQWPWSAAADRLIELILSDLNGSLSSKPGRLARGLKPSRRSAQKKKIRDYAR